MTEDNLIHSDVILKRKSLPFVRNTLNQFPLPPLFQRSHCHVLTEQLHKGEEKARFFPHSFSSPAPTANTSPSSSPASVLPSGRASSQGLSASLGSSHSSESSVKAWTDRGESCQIIALYLLFWWNAIWWHLILGFRNASTFPTRPSRKIKQLCTETFWLQVRQRDEGRGKGEIRIKWSINIMAED